MSTTRILLSTIVAGFTMMATSQTIYSQLLPFEASGSHALLVACDGQTKGIGNASYMGDVISSGLMIPIPTKDPLVFDLNVMHFELAAANGDQIFFHGIGSVEFMPLKGGSGLYVGFWTADLHVIEGTGQFKNVRRGPRPLHAYAVIEPSTIPFECPHVYWSYSWSLRGNIHVVPVEKRPVNKRVTLR